MHRKTDKDGRVTVIDVGISQKTDASGGAKAKGFGHPYLAPPEQLTQNRIDARSDVYTVAASTLMLARKDIHDPVLKKIIDKGMASDPNDRYLSMREFSEALSSWQRQYAQGVQTSR